MSITPSADGAGALATFGIQAGSQAGEEVAVRLPVATLGRGSQNDIVLTDDSVSTAHARLEYRNGGWHLTDLNSRNGTFIEDTRLAPEVPTLLRYGSVVRLGFARLHFRAVEAADPEAARAAYQPPPPRETVRERRAGFRLPIWLVLLVVVLIVLALLLFGWLGTEPVGVEPVQTSLLILLPHPGPPPRP